MADRASDVPGAAIARRTFFVLGSVGLLVAALYVGRYIFVTLALAELIRLVAQNWLTVTGGPFGIYDFGSFAELPASGLARARAAYLLVAVVVAAGIALMLYVCRRTRAGRGFRAIREDEVLAESLGINTTAYKLLAFGVSSGLAGLAGTLYALLNNFADPHDLRWDQSGDFVIMAVLGGMRAFWGPLIGAAIFVVLQDYLSSETANWMSFIGLFFVLVVLFFPRGVLGIIQRRAAP